MLQKISTKLKNDIYFSTCFTLLFTAYYTQSHIQKTLTVSIQNENKNYTVDGYVCFSIIYAFFSFAMWLSPATLVFLGRKLTIMLGTVFYTTFVSCCYFENVAFTYVSSALTGIGAALLWTGQANYIVLNSEVGDVYQGISLFWMLYQCSNLLGNACVYFQFHDPNTPIDKTMRLRIMLILLAFVFLSMIMMCFLRPPIRNEEDQKKIRNPLDEIKKAFRILFSKTWLLLWVMFIYAGIHVTFLSVLGASIGFSKYLSANSREFAPLSGFVQGTGQIAGCAFSLFFNKKQAKLRTVKFILIVGGLMNFLAYIIDFVCLPDSSSFTYTDHLPVISVSFIYPMISNIMVGIGDACITIEIYQCIGALYPDDSAPAFTAFKFIRCLAVSVSFYYSNLIGLHIQLIILCVFGFLGIFSYQYVASTSKMLEKTGKLSAS